jgi:hypothetical protein
MTRQILEMNQRTWRDVRSPLLNFQQNVFSQAGEDGVIEKILSMIPETTKFFVEFGAWDGLHLSNCARLAREAGWSGIFIEGNEQRFADLLANYAEWPQITSINAWISLDAGSRLDELVSPRTTDVGVLSIDIDGNDYHIWESVTTIRPTLVVIEINPSIPNDVKFVQEYDLRKNQGASLSAMVALGARKGYELICCTSLNAFFVDNQYFPRFNVDNSNLDYLFIPKCNGRVFHGYDGTIFTVGMDRLIWQSRPVKFDDLQILPVAERQHRG